MGKKKLIVFGALALLLIVSASTVFVLRSNNANEDAKTAPPPTTDSTSGNQAVVEGSIEKLSKEYQGYTGEDYDRMFISNMMAHHQGAIDMANLALKNASHQEIKELAKNIVADQTREISDLLAWQKQWGYPSTSGEMMMEHSSMNMTDEMSSMTNQLTNKSGDEFDRTFLTLMIEHHQSAIAMAKPGPTNASHAEIKELSAAIVSAQSDEIARMQQWQQQWGYGQ